MPTIRNQPTDEDLFSLYVKMHRVRHLVGAGRWVASIQCAVCDEYRILRFDSDSPMHPPSDLGRCPNCLSGEWQELSLCSAGLFNATTRKRPRGS